MDQQTFHEALEEVWKVIRAANGYIDRQAPWALAGPTRRGWATVLRVLADALRVIATVLQPFMPGSMARMLDQLGVPADARHWPIWRRRWRTGRRCRRRKACSRAMWSRPREAASGFGVPYADRFALPSRLLHRAELSGGAGPRGGGRGGRDGHHRHHAGAVRNACRRWPRRIRTSGAPSASIRTTPPRSADARRRRPWPL